MKYFCQHCNQTIHRAFKREIQDHLLTCYEAHKMPTLEEIINGITDHDQKNPMHGVNCACMDKYIEMVRSLLYANDPTNQERMRIDYVFRSAMKDI